MSNMDWVDERLEGHRQRLARGQQMRRQRRRRVRDLARITLAVMLVVLAVLAMGIGRQAMAVVQHAQAVEQI